MSKHTPSISEPKETADEAPFESGEAETWPDAPEPTDEDEDNTLTLKACETQVRRAAMAVVDEARRLQSEMERYAAHLLAATSRDISESASLPEEELLLTSDSDNAVTEALAIVDEALRLQEHIQRLYILVNEAVRDDKADDD